MTTFSSSSRYHPHVFKFVNGSVYTDNGQDFIKVSSSLHCVDNTLSISRYYISNDGMSNFMEELVPLIAQNSGLTNPSLIGPTYFKKNGDICNYQCSVTGTAKLGETEIMTLQRELAEEIGFVVKSSALSSLVSIPHTMTVKGGTEVRECITFLINVADIEPVTHLNVSDCIPFFNVPDFVGTSANGVPLQKKIQAFIYGNNPSCMRVLGMHTAKPVKFATDDVVRENPIFYDADIKGLTIFSLNKMSRRFGVST